MGKLDLRHVTITIVILVSILKPSTAFASVDDISVIEATQEDVLVRGRVAYYTYRLQVSNDGVPLTNVSAVVASTSRSIRVTERRLDFDDLASNQQVASNDTFTIRVGARTSPDLSLLTYTFEGDEVIVDEDLIPPTISASLSAAANNNGWHNAPVIVSFTCIDNVAIAACSEDVLVDVDGANQLVVGTAQDTSGNTSSTQISINLDTQAPVVSANLANSSDTPPSDNATLLQKIAIDTSSEANAQTQVLLVQDGVSSFVGSATADNLGTARFNDIQIDLGITDFNIQSTDIADNQGEIELSIERLQCKAQPQSRSFYLSSNLDINTDLSLLNPQSNNFVGTYQQFRGDTSLAISVVPAFLNDDVLLDWIIVDGDPDGVNVLINDGSGQFSGAGLHITGFINPTVAIVSNLIGSEALDLVVGHNDGTVAIYAGLGDGSFSLQAGEIFTSSSAVVELNSGDFNQDGVDDLLVLSANELTLFTRNSAAQSEALIRNGNFSNGLSAWMVNATGHTSSELAGTVTRAANGARLFENGSFLVSLFQTFSPAAETTTLSFTLSSIVLEQSSGAIPDILEVSLLNANQQSLIPTVHPNATSFLNIAANGEVKTANGVTFENGQVSVDISAIDTDATLYFDLIGQPPQQGATFVVSNVDAGQSIVVDDSFTSLTISNQLAAANGAVFCDAVANTPPILVSDPGNSEITIFEQDANGVYTRSSALAQGGQ